jgi:D-2-hydroxyacid dehydrogenase (NADP+)
MLFDRIRVVYSRPLKGFGALSLEHAEMIRRVSPKIELLDISKLVEAENRGDLESSKQLDEILARTDLMYGFPPPVNLLARAPRLRWIQNPLVGVEMFLKPDFVASSVKLTNARGIHDQVAEIALMLALMLGKNAVGCLNQKQSKQWKQYVPGHLSGNTMGVIGLGHIGRQIARLGKAFHMHLIATELKTMKKPAYIDSLLPADKLPQLLEQVDYLVLAVPLTRETRGLISEHELRLMKPSAFLINIARGGLVDEEALIQALKEQWISGAGLDVYASEPLSENSPLWSLSNVILTPHIAGLRKDYDLLTTRLFCRNLKRFLAGKELLNTVDKVKGF